MVRKTVEAQDERPAAGLQDRNLQSACLNRPATDTVTGGEPTCRRVPAGRMRRRSLCLGCHAFNLSRPLSRRHGPTGPDRVVSPDVIERGHDDVMRVGLSPEPYQQATTV